MVYLHLTMSQATREAKTDSIPAKHLHRWTARIGLVIVAAILVSCFSLLIAAGHAQ